ncbi:MAG: hypothetical protein N2V76_06200 [Methanophagales archaeon]|nr:hypothetical protein [Methanophagales archaeon]
MRKELFIISLSSPLSRIVRTISGYERSSAPSKPPINRTFLATIPLFSTSSTSILRLNAAIPSAISDSLTPKSRRLLMTISPEAPEKGSNINAFICEYVYRLVRYTYKPMLIFMHSILIMTENE